MEDSSAEDDGEEKLKKKKRRTKKQMLEAKPYLRLDSVDWMELEKLRKKTARKMSLFVRATYSDT